MKIIEARLSPAAKKFDSFIAGKLKGFKKVNDGNYMKEIGNHIIMFSTDVENNEDIEYDVRYARHSLSLYDQSSPDGIINALDELNANAKAIKDTINQIEKLREEYLKNL